MKSWISKAQLLCVPMPTDLGPKCGEAEGSEGGCNLHGVCVEATGELHNEGTVLVLKIPNTLV